MLDNVPKLLMSILICMAISSIIRFYIFNTVHHNKPNRYDYGEIEKNVTICNISRDKVL